MVGPRVLAVADWAWKNAAARKGDNYCAIALLGGGGTREVLHISQDDKRMFK